jgi:peptidoglycan/LPS O-acetylase OafA/YrhL
MPLLFVLLMMSAFRGYFSSRLLALAWITNIGGMCYSIYLLHFRLLSLFDHFTKPIHLGHSFVVYLCLQAMMVIPPLLAACTVYFLLIERPCMNRNWLQKLLNKISRQRTVAGIF